MAYPKTVWTWKLDVSKESKEETIIWNYISSNYGKKEMILEALRIHYLTEALEFAGADQALINEAYRETKNKLNIKLMIIDGRESRNIQ